MIISKRIIFLCILFFTLMVISGCSSDNSEGEGSPSPTPIDAVLTDKEVKLLDDAGMNQAEIERMVKAVSRQEYPNIHSILIVKDNNLVLERYFSGIDENWGYNIGVINHSRETLHDLRSITKSVVAACIGIALFQGKIESLDQNIFDFFPDYQQYKTGLRAEITIKDLLTMTPGMEWDETSIPYTNPANPEIQLTNHPDPIGYVLSRPMRNTPGEKFGYNGGATQLLAGIIAEVSGMEVQVFAEEFLFRPLGIERFKWHLYSNSNLPAATSGLRLRSRDLMKFGLLYHYKGVWEGNRILPQTWIQESFSKQIDKPNQTNGFFGYHFHIHPSFITMGKTIQHVAAVGNGDQRIFFNENEDLIVVITAGNYNRILSKNSLSLMKDFIYPSIFN